MRGLELCILEATPGASFSIFTGSQAAMTRLRDDRPGPGQRMATRGIPLARETIQRGASVTIRWMPGHAGVLGNEIADQWTLDAATREHRCHTSEEALGAPRSTSRHTSQTFMKTALKMRAVSMWREEIISRSKGRRSFRLPWEGEVPRIPPDLRRAPKEVASRFFQLASGHAMIAPFLRDKFGWVESDSCWWCSGGRQSREHLFKECRTWKEEIRTLWKEVGKISGCCERREVGRIYKGKKGFCLCMGKKQARPGNLSIGRLMSDTRFTEAVLKFLRSTGVGKVKEGVLLEKEGQGQRE